MALQRGHRFPVEFVEAFPRGLVLIGEIEPDLEYVSQEDRARGREARQLVDEITKQRQWRGTVTDPDEQKAKRASFDVIFTAEVQPAPLPDEVLPGMRPVELVGLTASPKVMGQGEFKFLGYEYRASGVKHPGTGDTTRPVGRPDGTAQDAAKASEKKAG
ncbi:hypothetical protein [Jiangella alkaliphila]|uniref:Uncharacterized protein n=1 Tax=Jiangella alkaliphila TaxID=419479 RepID=A0A1H2H3H7_9ACTN|nr:hypothetical protein [Jiangella alkaliphila]SDU26437.1 hypothetical protein SAMN04488563_0824 [Jiangella alkaliphila]